MSKPNAKRDHLNTTKIHHLPNFESEAQEREFWASEGADAAAFFDPSTRVVATFKNLKLTTTIISLRVADSLLDGFRQEANKVDVPHQSVMKVWLTETLRGVNG